MTTNLTTRLTERAKAFNDAGLTHGVADLLTEAAGELGRIEQALAAQPVTGNTAPGRLVTTGTMVANGTLTVIGRIGFEDGNALEV